MYAIRIEGLNKFVSWCEDRWYETSIIPKHIFTLEDAERICKHLKLHCYQPRTTILDEMGLPITTKNPNPKKTEIKKESKDKGKKVLFTLNSSLLRKN